jgi:hypothetical protein
MLEVRAAIVTTASMPAWAVLLTKFMERCERLVKGVFLFNSPKRITPRDKFAKVFA